MSINQRHSHSGRGGDGEKISYNDLKNKPEVSTPKFFTTYIKKTSGEGDGDIYVPCGFKPSYVHMYSIYHTGDDRRGEESNSRTVNSPTLGLQTTTAYKSRNSSDNETLGTGDSNIIPCVYIDRSTSAQQVLFMKEFDETGFTLEYGENEFIDVGMHIVAMA